MKESQYQFSDAVRNEIPDNVPFWTKLVTLVAVDKTGKVYAAKSAGGKGTMIDCGEKPDTFCFIWVGQWSSDCFPITLTQLKAIAKEHDKRR